MVIHLASGMAIQVERFPKSSWLLPIFIAEQKDVKDPSDKTKCIGIIRYFTLQLGGVGPEIIGLFVIRHLRSFKSKGTSQCHPPGNKDFELLRDYHYHQCPLIMPVIAALFQGVRRDFRSFRTFQQTFLPSSSSKLRSLTAPATPDAVNHLEVVLEIDKKCSPCQNYIINRYI